MSMAAGTIIGPTAVVFEQWDDLRRDGFTTRIGSTAPAFSTGFAGNAGLGKTVWAKTGSEYIYFQIQFPHHTKVGSRCYPHVHFAPIDSTTGTVEFILEYTTASSINEGTFGTSKTIAMDYVIASDKTWKNLIADNHTGIATEGMSEIWNCSITRNNSVSGNLDQVVAHLYFDIHYIVDSMGSNQEYVK